MALHQMMFDVVVSLVEGATKSQKKNVYHTWDGWISKGVLHITSRSGARARDAWHFSLEKNHGGRLFFKNKTHTAYVYARSGAQNELERTVFALNPFCRVEYVDAINVDMHTRGDGCGHSTADRPSWYLVVTDGKVEVVSESPPVGHHHNQYHRGCPSGTDTVHVAGGTYAIQIDVGQSRSSCEPTQVVVTRGASLGHVAKVLEADAITRRLAYGYCQRSYDGSHHPEEAREHILRLAREVAEGYPYPDALRERVWKLVGEGTPAVFVPAELCARVAHQRPSEIAHRALVDRIVQQMRGNLQLYACDGQPEFAFFLRKEETPDWEQIFGFGGKLGRFSPNCHVNGERRDYKVQDTASIKVVETWPAWVEENVRRECEMARGHGELERVPDNLRLAQDLAVVVFREEYDCWGDHRPKLVRFHNGSDPNVGFGFVQWNPYGKRAT